MKNSDLYKLAAHLLKMGAEAFAQRGCNDINLKELIPDADARRAVVKAFHERNGDPQDFDPARDYALWFDWLLMYQVAAELDKRTLSAEIVEHALEVGDEVKQPVSEIQIVTGPAPVISDPAQAARLALATAIPFEELLAMSPEGLGAIDRALECMRHQNRILPPLKVEYERTIDVPGVTVTGSIPLDVETFEIQPGVMVPSLGIDLTVPPNGYGEGGPYDPDPAKAAKNAGDPVHQAPLDGTTPDGWFFWDETWSERHGPFDDEATARRELRYYGAHLEGGPEAVEALKRKERLDMWEAHDAPLIAGS